MGTSQKRHKFISLKYVSFQKSLSIHMRLWKWWKIEDFDAREEKKLHLFVSMWITSGPIYKYFLRSFLRHENHWTNRKSRKMNFYVWRKDIQCRSFIFFILSHCCSGKKRKETSSRVYGREMFTRDDNFYLANNKMHFITVFPSKASSSFIYPPRPKYESLLSFLSTFWNRKRERCSSIIFPTLY